MASIHKTKSGKWRVELFVRGKRSSGTFSTKHEAKNWAADERTRLLSEVSNGIPKRPFRDLMERYAKEVTPTKRGMEREHKMINVILRDPIAEVPLPEIASSHFGEWRERRLQKVSGSTVNREMNILSNACNIARREWGWLKDNPMTNVRRPKSSDPRTRRPTDGETEALLYCLGYDPDQPPVTQMARVGAMYLFAIETAMRAGEICGLRWEHVFDRHVHIPRTKNGSARDVPLSPQAKAIVDQVKEVTWECETVFNVDNALRDALFRKARDQAMIEDLNFHDTRREALTRLSKVYDVLELSRISGHKDLRILRDVYYAPRISDLSIKLWSEKGSASHS